MTWRRTARFVRWQLYLLTMVYSLVADGIKPSTWRNPIRSRLERQIFFSGVEAMPFTIMAALVVGVAIFLQCQVWLSIVGEMQLLSRFVSALLIREAAPFLVSFIVISASASAMTTELATMKISGQIALLQAQGINLFRFLALPRMLGVGTSVLVLSISGMAILGSAIAFLVLTDQVRGTFITGVLESLNATDLLILFGKSFLPGICTGAICCHEGLRIEGDSTEIPKAVSQAMLRSVSVSILIWGVILVMTFI